MRFVAGRGAVAELLLAWAPWRSAIGKMLLAGAPCQRCCWQGRCSGTAGRECHGEEDGGTVAKSHRESAAGRSSLHGRQCGSIGKSLPLHGRRCGCIGKPTSAHKKRRARKRPKYLSRAASIYCLAKGQHALAKLPLQLCRDCKEGCSKCKNCVELWEYGKDKGVTEYVLSV